MKLVPFAVAWAVLATAVAVLALYRRMVAAHEDDSIHLNADAGEMAQQQQVIAQKLQVVDRLGIGLTILAAVTGLALLGAFVYMGWVDSYRLPE